jgi:hypothetical protein
VYLCRLTDDLIPPIATKIDFESLKSLTVTNGNFENEKYFEQAKMSFRSFLRTPKPLPTGRLPPQFAAITIRFFKFKKRLRHILLTKSLINYAS